jgi:hypothetical protein
MQMIVAYNGTAKVTDTMTGEVQNGRLRGLMLGVSG